MSSGLTFTLGISSADEVQFYPNFDYSNALRQIQNVHRSRSGKRKVYKWGDYRKANFTVEFVPSSSAAIVNSWHSTNTELLLFVTSGSVTEVHSVMLVGVDEPFAQFQEPYDDLMKGKLSMETY